MLRVFRVFLGISLGLGFSLVVISGALAEVDKKAENEKHQQELIGIVESSCKKACSGDRGEQAFCTSYCKCVTDQVKNQAKNTEIAKILNGKSNREVLIKQCSGQTAVKYFGLSCRDKCNGAPNCNSYCSCLEDKIKFKRKLAEIGDFFIQLGKNEEKYVSRLKRYETACTR